jgi:hypothetical protein
VLLHRPRTGSEGCGPRRLTIVGGVRERSEVPRRGRGETLCARSAWSALLGGPSTSPLDGMKAPSQQLPLERALSVVGQCTLTLGALLLAIGLVGGPLRRPGIAYALLAVGLSSSAAVAVRTGDRRSPLRAALAFAGFGAIAGALIGATRSALASKSWFALALLVAGSAVLAGVSFYYGTQRDRKLSAKERVPSNNRWRGP